MSLSSLSRYSGLGLLALRLAVGVIFLIHGHAKWGMWSAAPGGMPVLMVTLFRILAIVEPLAGLAILLGLWARAGALALVVVMLGAIYMKITAMQIPFMAASTTGWEFDLMLLAANIALLFVGPGKYAVMRE